MIENGISELVSTVEVLKRRRHDAMRETVGSSMGCNRPTRYFENVEFGIGYYGGYGWGWHHWGSDWHGHYITHDHDRYYSQSHTFYNRNNYYRGEGERGRTSNLRGGGYGDHGGSTERPVEANRSVRGHAHPSGGDFNRPEATTRPFNGNTQAARGYAEPRGESGVRSGALGGYDHGGEARGYSSRGSASFGGGRSFGGGESHGGGHR
jgi:hypothetical protein